MEIAFHTLGCKVNQYETEAMRRLMEAAGYTPWMLEERLAIREAVARNNPDCKVVMLVDDAADKALAESVKQAKRDGLIDAFLFGSVTEQYMAAVMDSL